MAVFIPLLLMGGIVGRLFREFAVTVTLTIAVSVLVSLTLTPMLCARFLKDEHRTSGTAGSTSCSSAASTPCCAATSAGWTSCCGTSSSRLCVFLATVAATVACSSAIPKGFFPQQDTGFIFGIARVGAGLLVRGDAPSASMQVADIIRAGPRRRRASACFGGSGSTFNTGNFFIGLQAQGRGPHGAAPTRSSRGCGRKLAKVEGARCSCRPAQDINVGGRLARTQYQYTLTDANLDELNEWAPKLLGALAESCRN